MAGHAKKCVDDIVSWQTRRLSNSTKYLLHALMTTTSKKKRNLLENLSHVCSQIVLKCLQLARIGRLDILWSVNKLARSITKWTNACDKRLNRLLSYIHHTCYTNNIVMWVILLNNADWDCFKTLTLREILKIQNPLLEEHFAFFGSHTFVPISLMCKKQTAVSYSSTESEIIFGHWTEIWMLCPLWNYGI